MNGSHCILGLYTIAVDTPLFPPSRPAAGVHHGRGECARRGVGQQRPVAHAGDAGAVSSYTQCNAISQLVNYGWNIINGCERYPGMQHVSCVMIN